MAMQAICVGRMSMVGDDETHQRREIPPFPWDSLRYILTGGGEYSPDTSLKPVPISTRNTTGIRGQVINRAAYGPVMECIGRAFGENAKRHKLFPAHWPVFLACEVGLVQRPDRRGLPRWAIYRPERPDAVVPDHEAAVLFGVSTETIRMYLGAARRAVEDEWCSFHAGWDGGD
jgi:hypothetical protein